MTIDEILKEFDEKWEDEFCEYVKGFDGIKWWDSEKVREWLSLKLKEYAVGELEELIKGDISGVWVSEIKDKIKTLKGG
jgi:hypothetical protein